MSLKTVSVIKDGQNIRSFVCSLCDISERAIKFRGVHATNGNNHAAMDVNYFGNIYFEVDHLKKEAVVLPDYPGVQILITW